MALALALSARYLLPYSPDFPSARVAAGLVQNSKAAPFPGTAFQSRDRGVLGEQVSQLDGVPARTDPPNEVFEVTFKSVDADALERSRLGDGDVSLKFERSE